VWSSPEIVTVIVSADTLFCTWLVHSKKDKLSFSLRAYEAYRPDFVYTNATSLLTTTYFIQCMRDFLHRNSLKNPFVLLGFASDTLYENYYWIERDSTAMNLVQQENRLLVWNYCVLDHTSETDDTLLYVYGLSRMQIFQHQVAALTVPFNCIFMTSVKRALLNLLWSVRSVKSSAEVVSGKTLDFSYRLTSLIEFLDYNDGGLSHYSESEVEALCASMGLYLLGENYESL